MPWAPCLLVGLIRVSQIYQYHYTLSHSEVTGLPACHGARKRPNGGTFGMCVLASQSSKTCAQEQYEHESMHCTDPLM